MATEEHQSLAHLIKSVHYKLRIDANKYGAEEAWNLHLKNPEILNDYSIAMKTLATNFWEENNRDENKSAESRIDWVRNYCLTYFYEVDILKHHRKKETEIFEKISGNLDEKRFINFNDKIKLIDVGSCYNPFKGISFIDVTAIDIAPANNDVFKCDFLQVKFTSLEVIVPDNSEITTFEKKSFDVVVFSLLLEYMPSSDQRLELCRNAYEILKYEGLLFVITPDSRHVGANAKLMKNWRYVLAKMGFSRIKITKLSHITCMVFRKCLQAEVAQRWGELHKETYMTDELNIPQDFRKFQELDGDFVEEERGNDIDVKDMFFELPGEF